MTTRYTTEDIRREFGYGSRTSVRQRLKRWRDAGVVFDVEVDPQTNEKLYADRLPIKSKLRLSREKRDTAYQAAADKLSDMEIIR